MEASDLTGHISKRFNKDLEDLRSMVLSMGGLVESQLQRAITAIVSGDSESWQPWTGRPIPIASSRTSVRTSCTWCAMR